MKFIASLLEHRTFTHSLLFTAILTPVSPFIALGVLSHILMDMFNPQGVEIFFPFGRKIAFPVINRLFVTGSTGEKILRYILYILIAVAVFAEFHFANGNQWDLFDANLNNIGDNIVRIYDSFKDFVIALTGQTDDWGDINGSV